MRVHVLRSALVAVGAGLMLIAGTVSSAAALHPASNSPAPDARHSGQVVPGPVGSAAPRALPAEVSQHFQELNASRHGATPAAPAAGTALAVPASAGTGNMSPLSWTGTLHGDWGTFPSGTTLHGAQATQSLNPSARVVGTSSAGSDFLFAPTLDPSGITCIETTTIYEDGQVQIGAFDWCAAQPNWGKISNVDSTFLSTYVASVNGRTVYSVQDVQTDPVSNQWTAYLYNYQTNAWDVFYQSAGTSVLGNPGSGYDLIEVYTYYNSTTGQGQYCTQIPGAVFQTSGLQYQTSYGGDWTLATTANSSSPQMPSDHLGCLNLTNKVTTPNNEFGVTINNSWPYGGSLAAVPGTVQAENYDSGGPSAAYNVNSVNGTANSYRSDGVDLETAADTGGGYNLGWTGSGQWFRYTIDVASAGTYNVNLRVAAPTAVTGALHLSDASGTNLSGAINVPATGGWQNWTTVTATVTLPAGRQVLTLNQDNGGWNINALTFAANINSSTWYEVVNQNSGSCVDNANSSTANGTAVQQWSCSGAPNQQWQFAPTSGGYYRAVSRNAAAQNEVWDVTGGPQATASGTPVQTWSYGGGTNQQWQPIPVGGGYYTFMARNSGLCLDIPAASTANGIQLQVYTCNGTPAQAFRLIQQP